MKISDNADSACLKIYVSSCLCMGHKYDTTTLRGYEQATTKNWRYFLSASLYFSKRGAYWDRLCRDVVGRWLVGCYARALWPNGAS